MFPPNVPWNPAIDWTAPAGIALLRLVTFLPKDRNYIITVFGSSPLQLGLDPSFISGDVDVFSDDDLRETIARAGLDKASGGTNGIYVEQTAENIFIVSPSWRNRAFSVRRENVDLTFPHPIDILVAKLKRLAPKDLRAFRLVFDKTGHPTEPELKLALSRVIDMFKPAFDEEETGGDPYENTRTVWRELYGKEIDVRAEIIIPTLAVRKEASGGGIPNHNQELKRCAE